MDFFSLKLRNLAIKCINLYQKTISLDHSRLGKALFPSGYCRFHPTCSEYTKQAIGKYGVIRGCLMGSWRILRCNPFSRGGDDPVR